nr:glycosyltransferase [Novosphingobium aerophilum]
MASAAAWCLPGKRGSPAPEPTAAEVWPGVSIIVPTRDQAGLLAQCVAGLDGLAYPGPVELMVIDNGSSEPETHALFDRLAQRPRTRILSAPGSFNFAALMNRAADDAREPFLCLLNNDVVPLDGGWLAAMMRHAREPGVGAVGARLLYPDRTVQHVGVAVGIGGAAGHVAKGARPGAGPFALWHGATRRVSAVTAACLLVEGARYRAVGGMDAAAFAVDFNDVDLCLRLDRAGWQNRVVVEATLVHYESRSRGHRRTGPALARFEAELAELRQRWETATALDPWHSPLFSRESEQCLLRC